MVWKLNRAVHWRRTTPREWLDFLADEFSETWMSTVKVTWECLHSLNIDSHYLAYCILYNTNINYLRFGYFVGNFYINLI
jgi:hypothetical protein